MNSISKDRAIEIAKEFAINVSKIVGNSLIAVYAIGSLGGNYYRPGQSDIDTLIILDDFVEFDEALIEKIAQEYQRKYDIPKGFGAIIIRKAQLFPPYNKTDELVLEIINLKKQGLLLCGEFDINSVPMPDRNEIIDDANAFEDWREKEFINANPILSMTACSNSILILLKRYLLIEKGIFEFNKLKVIDAYLNNDPPIVNQEIFHLISNYINSTHSEKQELTEQELNRMNKFHDNLLSVMNRILLSR